MALQFHQGSIAFSPAGKDILLAELYAFLCRKWYHGCLDCALQLSN